MKLLGRAFWRAAAERLGKPRTESESESNQPSLTHEEWVAASDRAMEIPHGNAQVFRDTSSFAFVEDPPFDERVRKRLPNFPAIECPDDYKLAICALCSEDDIAKAMRGKIPYLNDRSIEQCLREKDFPALLKWIRSLQTFLISGPGAE